MGEFTNKYADTRAADYLEDDRRHIAQTKNGNISQQNRRPNGIIPREDAIEITDAVEIDPNKTELSDTINITDAVTTTEYTSGAFTVSLKDDGSDQSQPLKVSFGDVG